MNNQTSTKENINKLVEFGQAIYENGMRTRHDAMFDLLDALIIVGPVSSFAMLSQSSRFQRKWPSLYAAVEDGELDHLWLEPIWPGKYRSKPSRSTRWMAHPGPDRGARWQKFKTRHATFGFQDPASLDEGHMWSVSFALKEFTAAEEERIVALVKKAVS